MRRIALAACVVASPALASNGARDVRLVSADQVGSCTHLGSVTETRSSGRNPDEAAQKALSTAMDKAAKAGANVGVIADGSSPVGHQTVTLQTYHCGDQVGVAPTN